MKFRNPKTGEVYENIKDALIMYECMTKCMTCKLSYLNNPLKLACGEYSAKIQY